MVQWIRQIRYLRLRRFWEALTAAAGRHTEAGDHQAADQVLAVSRVAAVHSAAVAAEEAGKMKTLIIILLGFSLLLGCQTSSTSSQDSQSELEKYLGKKVEYKLTPLTSGEERYPVIYFDSSVNLYHEAPLDMSFVSMLKSYVSEVNIHVRTTKEFSGEFKLPYPGFIWEGSSNFFARVITTTSSETFDNSSFEAFIEKYKGKIVGDQIGQSEIVFTDFPKDTEIEYSISARTTLTPSIIRLSWQKNSKFRRLGIRTNLTTSVTQWQTELPLIFNEKQAGLSDMLADRATSTTNTLGKIYGGKETASLTNQEVQNPYLTIYQAEGYDLTTLNESQLLGLDVFGLFKIRQMMDKTKYDALMNDLFLQCGFNKEKRTGFKLKPDSEIISTLTTKLNSINDWKFLEKYFSGIEIYYRHELLKKICLFLMLDSYSFSKLHVQYVIDNSSGFIKINDVVLTEPNNENHLINASFTDNLKTKTNKTK